jgi:hypothetical protein
MENVALAGGIVVPIIGSIPAAAFKHRRIKKAAKKTGRKFLPNMMRMQSSGKRITFVAHSLGAYMLYKLFKKFGEYPLYNPIDDVILLGGAVSKCQGTSSFPQLGDIHFPACNRESP